MRVWIRLFAASSVLVVLLASAGYAQGPFLRTVTFDAPPFIPPGDGIMVTYYYEDSFTFTPMRPGDKFTRAGGVKTAFPDNGTAHLTFLLGNSLSGSRGGVSRFGLHSVDLAEFSTLYPYPRTVQFIGYRPDGSSVTTEFTTDSVIDGTGPLADFQTFYFDSRFSDLVSFEAPDHTYALDNLVFYDVIPEPSAGALLLVGGLLLLTCRARSSERVAWR